MSINQIKILHPVTKLSVTLLYWRQPPVTWQKASLTHGKVESVSPHTDENNQFRGKWTLQNTTKSRPGLSVPHRFWPSPKILSKKSRSKRNLRHTSKPSQGILVHVGTDSLPCQDGLVAKRSLLTHRSRDRHSPPILLTYFVEVMTNSGVLYHVLHQCPSEPLQSRNLSPPNRRRIGVFTSL